MHPDFSLEHALDGTICGIDEVGRGPLAGPVVAAAVILPDSLPEPLLRQLNDSKLLSAKKRDYLFDIIRDCAQVGLGEADVGEIDSINILQATFLAMRRAFDALLTQTSVDWALVDGNQRPPLPCRIQCVVKGDRKSLSIAAASVIAKVTRDRLMSSLALTMPGYGWDRNAGYGTAEHLAAIHNQGITPHHRRSFAPIRDLLLKE
ncbi:ribonuclease HII [Telmatospirillum siberiense]|uniref:Ribonuclease HII n=1 Tax=Telmatospirillum siberiense TaxID=382514 RepID=A0A2N3PTR4_9PROT|nr:ribonuclease HII [Telmatospirillum siberiense]PKU23777.1 ribonuclease HII [Telmatospirillum siberiense]